MAGMSGSSLYERLVWEEYAEFASWDGSVQRGAAWAVVELDAETIVEFVDVDYCEYAILIEDSQGFAYVWLYRSDLECATALRGLEETFGYTEEDSDQF